MAAKFFKEGNLWYYQRDGEINEQVVPSGNYVLQYEGTVISMSEYSTFTNFLIKDEEVTNIDKDRIGTAYIDVADFITTNEDFFIN